MSHELDPKVGRWYQRLDDEELFKVVSIDEDDGLIEIRTTDGELEELDATEWVVLDLEFAEAPEDFVDPDDESDDDELDEEEEVEPEPVDRPKRVGRGPSEDWEEDDDDDWDDDEDEDYDSDR